MYFLPVLPLIFGVKIAENSLDYSLENTSRQALWLVTSRDAKYKAKAVIDTFLVRAGDVCSAGVVWIGTMLGFATTHFIAVNAGMALVWTGIVFLLTREYAKRSRQEPAAVAVREAA
jgi:AAA family ATP:ADP antiporter